MKSLIFFSAKTLFMGFTLILFSCTKTDVQIENFEKNTIIEENNLQVSFEIKSELEKLILNGNTPTEGFCKCSVEIIDLDITLSSTCDPNHTNIAFALDSRESGNLNGFCTSPSCLKFSTGYANVNHPLCDPNNGVACADQMPSLSSGHTVDLNCEIPEYGNFVLNPYVIAYDANDCTQGSCGIYEGTLTYRIHCIGELLDRNCEQPENIAYTTYSSEISTIDFDQNDFLREPPFGIVLAGCGCDPTSSTPSSL